MLWPSEATFNPTSHQSPNRYTEVDFRFTLHIFNNMQQLDPKSFTSSLKKNVGIIDIPNTSKHNRNTSIDGLDH